MKVGTGIAFDSSVIGETHSFRSLAHSCRVVLLTQLVQLGHMLRSSLWTTVNVRCHPPSVHNNVLFMVSARTECIGNTDALQIEEVLLTTSVLIEETAQNKNKNDFHSPAHVLKGKQ